MTDNSLQLSMDPHDREEEDNQELDHMAHYLRTLKKKVECHVKNPFEMPFANFSFETLASWQNNVLQLDATSKLYGHRVDNLHSGTLQILGSVINTEQARQQPETAHQNPVKKAQVQYGNPIQRNLQQPHKLNSEPSVSFITPLLWNQICKKRDALSQLMLNETPIDRELRVALFDSEEVWRVPEDNEVYIKLAFKNKPTLSSLYLFQEISSTVQELNHFLLTRSSHSERIREEHTEQVDYMIDFEMNFEPQEDDINFRELQCPLTSFGQMSQQISQNSMMEITEDGSQSGSSQMGDSVFSFDDWQQDKPKKPSRRVKPSRRREINRRQVFVDFNQFLPEEREDVFLNQEKLVPEDRFLSNRDYLLLKVNKYHYPFKRGGGRREKSKIRPGFTSKRDHSYEPISLYEPETIAQPTEIQVNHSFNARNQKAHFHEAALPIKEMKKRIREVVADCDLPISFQGIRQNLRQESPLDIFMTTLHIAAEEQTLIMG